MLASGFCFLIFRRRKYLWGGRGPPCWDSARRFWVWSCATKELGSGSDQGAGAAAGSGLWRGLFHYVAEAYEQFAQLAAFFHLHVNDFEGACLGVGVADDG